MSIIKVILVDDHQLLIKGFKSGLESFGIEVVDSCSKPEDIMSAYFEKKPDVLVLDVRFNDETLSGIDICRKIKQKDKDAKIVILSQFDQENIIQESYKSGALSFISKNEDMDHIVKAVFAASKGEKYFSPSLAQKMAEFSIREEEKPQNILDEKELAVFKLIAEGSTHEEVAKELGVSLRFVGNQFSKIKAKLKINRPAEFTKLAIKHNIINP